MPLRRHVPPVPLLGALFLLGALAVGSATSAAGEGAWVTGAGTWMDIEAEAEWLALSEGIEGYRMRAGNESVTCQRGQGTLRAADGSGATGTCGGAAADGNTTRLWFETTEGARREGTFQATATTPILPTGPTTREASFWPAAILLAVSFLGVGGSTALAVLWHRERVLTMHLARRLATLRGESGRRTRGESEKDRVARILVRSRN